MQQRMDSVLWKSFEGLKTQVQNLPKQYSLELVALALPALTQMAQSQRQDFLQLVADLIMPMKKSPFTNTACVIFCIVCWIQIGRRFPGGRARKIYIRL